MGNSSVELGITITADGKVASAETDRVTQSLTDLGNSARKTSQDLASTDTSLKQLGETEAQAAARIKDMVAASLASQAAMANQANAANQAKLSASELDAAIMASFPTRAMERQLLASVADTQARAATAARAYAAEVTATRAAHTAAAAATQAAAAALADTAGAAEKSMFATAGAKRELITLGHEAMTGNFSRMPGSFVVLAERIGLSGSALTSIILPIAAVGAAAYVMYKIIHDGAEEMRQMDNALTATGNYAGLTSDQMMVMSKSVSDAGRMTIGTSKEVVTAIVASGRYSADNIAGLAKLTENYAALTGDSVDKALPKLVKMFEDPAKASETLNAQYHYLSVAELERIRTLENTGHVQDAVTLALDKLNGHLPDTTKSIDSFASAWDRAAKAVSAYYATQTAQATQPSEIERKQADISNLTKAGRGGMTDHSAELAKARDELSVLRDKQLLEQGVADRLHAQSLEIATQSAGHAEAIKSQLYSITLLNQRLEKLKNEPDPVLRAEAEREVRKQISDVYHSMSALGRADQEEEIASTLKLRDITIGMAMDNNDAQLKLGKITQTDHDTTKAFLEWDKNQMAQIAEQQILAITTLNTAERKRHEDQLVNLQAEEQQIKAKGSLQSQIDEKTATDAVAKAYDDMRAAISKAGSSEIAALDKSIAAQQLHNAEIGKTPAQIELAKSAIETAGTAQLQLEADALRYAAEFVDMSQQFKDIYTLRANTLDIEIAKRKELAGLLDDGAVLAASAEAAKAYAAECKRVAADAERTLTDGLMRSFEAGKGFATAFRDTLLNMFKTMVLRPVISFIISPISGAISAALAGGSGTALAAGTGQSSAGVGSWLNAGSMIKGGYDALNVGLSTTYASMANSTVGGYLGLSTQAAAGYAAPVYDAGGVLVSEGTGTAAGGMTSAGSAVGTGLGYAGAGLAGIAAGSLIAGNKQVVGLDGTTISAIGAVIGSIWGPVGTFIGGVAGGVLDAAFGMGPKQGGTTTLAGQFSQSGFSGAYQTPWHQDGGWFRSDQSGVDTSALAATQATAFQAMVVGTQSVFDKLTAASGEANTSLQGWTYSINEQVSTQAQQTQLISDVATSMGDYLIPSLAQFGKTGETLADTAVRMTDEFILTDKIASLMGSDTASAFGAIGMASAAARDSLVTLMGGVQNMTTVTQSYYTNFFSASEQHAIDLKALSDQFSSLSMVMPGTRDAFRTLVEQQDLSTTAGQQMYASLMSLNAAFAAVIPASAAAANAVLSLADQITATTTAAQTAVDAQIAASKSAASTAQNLAASYRQITVTLADEVAKIRGTSSTSGNLQTLYQTAMTGDSTALAALPKAADDFLAASLATAKTSTEYATAQAQVIGMLNDAGAASTGMANWYDNQTTLLQTQANLLDQIKTELAGPTPDTVLLNQQAGLLSTIGDLLREQTTQIVNGNGTQTLLMQDQTGKIILANGLTMDQTGIITIGNSFLAGTMAGTTAAINAGININSATSIGGYLDAVGTLLVGNNSKEAESARAALEVLRQTTADGLITTAEAAATTDALATLRASAALQSTAAIKATSDIQSAINAGININSAAVIGSYLDAVSQAFTGNNSVEAGAVRDAISILRQTTADGLITTAEAASTTAALGVLKADTTALLAQSLIAGSTAALDAVGSAAAIVNSTDAMKAALGLGQTGIQGLLTGQTLQIINGNLVLSDQKGLITASNQLLIDQTGKITLGNALVGTQTNQIITGNTTADTIKNLSSTGNSYSEEMLRALVSGASMQTDSLTSILTDNDKTVSLLQQLYTVTSQKIAQDEAAAAAQAEVDAKAAADRALTLKISETTAAFQAESSVVSTLKGSWDSAVSGLGGPQTGQGGPAGWYGNADYQQQDLTTGTAAGYSYYTSWNGSGYQAVYDAQAAYDAEVAKAYALWKAIPGHASGLDRVPYDDYLMRAHKDEAVLTAPQAATWRSGGQGAANDAVVMEIRSLRTEVAGLHSALDGVHRAANATAQNTRDTSVTLMGATRGGLAFVTVPA